VEKIKTKRLSFLPTLLLGPRGGIRGQVRFSLLRVQLSFSSHRTTEKRQRRFPHNPLLPRPWQLHCEKPEHNCHCYTIEIYTGKNPLYLSIFPWWHKYEFNDHCCPLHFHAYRYASVGISNWNESSHHINFNFCAVQD